MSGISVKIHGVGDSRTVELYTASYTGKLLYNSRNGAIQRTRPVPRACSAIQLYSARVYSRGKQFTAYTLYEYVSTALCAHPLFTTQVLARCGDFRRVFAVTARYSITTSVQAKIICNEYFGVRYLRPATTTVP